METQIRTYKMIAATGFAPNFDGGILTLATCKSGIRGHAKIKEWIAGFSSKKLNGDEVGQERLVYLAQVTDIFTFEDFWDKFPQKRPNNNPLGDNIFATEMQAVRDKYEYRRLEMQKYVAVKQCRKYEHDDFLLGELKSDKVLIFNKYRYFGKSPLIIPNSYRIKIPTSQATYGYISKGENVDKFVEFVFKHKNCFDEFYNKTNNNDCKKNHASKNTGILKICLLFLLFFFSENYVLSQNQTSEITPSIAKNLSIFCRSYRYSDFCRQCLESKGIAAYNVDRTLYTLDKHINYAEDIVYSLWCLQKEWFFSAVKDNFTIEQIDIMENYAKKRYETPTERRKREEEARRIEQSKLEYERVVTPLIQREDAERRQREEAEVAHQEQQEAARRQRQQEAINNRVSSTLGIDGTSAAQAGSPFGSTDKSTQSSGGLGSFNLSGRSIGSGGLPRPDYSSAEEGRIVINITVNPNGDVISAVIGRGTNIDNASMRRSALDAAKRAKFNRVQGANDQSGTITYIFRLM